MWVGLGPGSSGQDDRAAGRITPGGRSRNQISPVPGQRWCPWAHIPLSSCRLAPADIGPSLFAMGGRGNKPPFPAAFWHPLHLSPLSSLPALPRIIESAILAPGPLFTRLHLSRPQTSPNSRADQKAWLPAPAPIENPQTLPFTAPIFISLLLRYF